MKDRVKDIVVDDGVFSDMRDRGNKTLNLVGQDIYYNNSKKRFVVKGTK